MKGECIGRGCLGPSTPACLVYNISWQPLPFIMDFLALSKGTQKRLVDIESARKSGTSSLTDTELDWIRFAAVYSSGVSGASAPGTLDIPCISAPVEKVSACLSPAWIEIRCYHDNRTHVRVRCRYCEGCWHAWRHKVRNLIIEGCGASKVFMWTLTIPEYPSKMKGDRFDVAQERWHDLLRDASKRGVRFEYLRVVELQKRGTPHFHVAVRDFREGVRRLSDTKEIAGMLRGFGRRSGFGYREGKTTDFQAARLGAAGVASYMSKYLTKSEGYNALRREDGRAIRRYARSRGWSNLRDKPVFRYARVPSGISHDWKSEEPLPCVCGEGLTIKRERQVQRWVDACRREGRWIAPLGVADYILQKEKERCQSE